MNNIKNEVFQAAVKTLENRSITVVDVKKIAEQDFGEDVWTVEKLIPEHSITAISGAPGSFKTWLTLDIAKSVARGEPFLEMFKTIQGGVLILDKENHMKHTQKRLAELGIRDDPIHYIIKNDGFFVDNERDLSNLLVMIEKLEIKLVIFDSLVRIHTGDENDAKQISKVNSIFRKITNKGVTVLFIHHNRKENIRSQSTPNSMRGSSDILAGLDCLLQVTKISNESLSVTQSKLRQDTETEPFKINIVWSNNKQKISFHHAGKSDFTSQGLQDAKSDILVLLKDDGSKSRQELLDDLSETYKATVIDAALKELTEATAVTKEIGAKNRHSYKLKD